MSMSIEHIARRIEAGSIIPYLGPGLLALCADVRVPATAEALARLMTDKVSVPHKIRHRSLRPRSSSRTSSIASRW